MWSLQARLGVGLAASLAAVFALQWLVVTFAIRHVAESHVASRLEHDSDSIVAALALDPAGQLVLEDTRLGAIFRQAFSGHYYRIETEGIVLRSRSLWDQDLLTPHLAAGVTERRHLSGPQGQTLLVLDRGVRLHERLITVSVAEDLTPLAMELQRFKAQYALISAAALALLLAIQGVALRLGLSPLRNVRAELEQVARGEHERLSENAPREIQPIVRELNMLFGVLRERLERSRRSVGNLAHALKTPLTILSDLTHDKRLQRMADIQQPLAVNTEAIGRLVDRELKRARLAGSSAGARHFCAAEDVPELVSTLRAIHRDKPLDIELDAVQPTTWPFDREDMLELLGNLLDNACKWARSRIRLKVSGNESLRVTVEDDGPGCSTDELARIAARGVRLDEAAPGHGFGLSIARDIAAAYHGRLSFGRSQPLGGLRVELELPKPPSS